MGNNQNQIIKQALEIVSENNRFALKSITNNAAIKTNFYKLSDIDLRPDLREELDKKDEPSELRPIVPYDPIDNSDILKRLEKVDSEPESEDESEDEPEDKPRKPPKKTLYETLRDWTIKSQIDSIKDLYGVDVTGMSQKAIAELLEANYSPGPVMPTSKIVNTDLGRNR